MAHEVGRADWNPRVHRHQTSALAFRSSVLLFGPYPPEEETQGLLCYRSTARLFSMFNFASPPIAFQKLLNPWTMRKPALRRLLGPSGLKSSRIRTGFFELPVRISSYLRTVFLL